MKIAINLILLKIFFELLKDAFEAGKVLASNPRMNHAAALFGMDAQNYLFKDSGPGQFISINLYYLKFIIILRKNSTNSDRRL